MRKQVNFRLDEDTLDLIESVSWSLGISKTDVITASLRLSKEFGLFDSIFDYQEKHHRKLSLYEISNFVKSNYSDIWASVRRTFDLGIGRPKNKKSIVNWKKNCS